MTREELEELIKEDENPKLDFKRDYELKKEKSEYVKDIIALANGNKAYIGKSAYLIFGVIEHKNKENEIFGIDIEKDKQLIQRELITHVNNHIEVPIQSLEVNEYNINSKIILYVKIPFQDYLLILKKDLKDTSYKKGNLLYRIGEATLFKEESYNCQFRKSFEEAIEKYKEQEKNRQQAEQLKSLKLFESKIEIDDEYGSYKNQKDNVLLFASLPVINDFEARLTIECEMTIILENSTSIMVSIPEKEVLESLFSGYRFKPQEKNNRREWIIFFDEKSSLYTIRISSTVLDVSYKTIEILSKMLDDLQEIYVLKLNSVEDRLNSKNFPCSQEYRNGFELCQIDLFLWEKIQKFIVQHDYLNKGEWNIFNAYSHYAVRNITIYDKKSNKVISELAFKIDDSDVLKPKITLIWNTLNTNRLGLNDVYMSVEESFYWFKNKLILKVKQSENKQKYKFKFLQNESKEKNIFKIYSLKEEKENISSLSMSGTLVAFFGYNEVTITKNILKNLYKGLRLLFENSEKLDNYYLYKKFYNIGSKKTLPQDYEEPEDYFSREITREYYVERINIEINEIDKGNFSISELVWGCCTLTHILSCYTVIIRDNFHSYSDVIIYGIEQSLKELKEIYDVLKVRERRLSRM